MQRDGNLVMYREDGQAMWASGTSGDKNSLVFQGDGNLVIYGNDWNINRPAKWDSGTDTNRQNYDKPVMWNGFTDKPNKTRWVQAIDEDH